MNESITGRVSRIISGSLNALVDAVENTAPETVLEQAIREIDSAIDEVRSELGRVISSKHLANTRLMEENRKHEALSEQLELAIREKRDELAEAAIAKQLDIEAQIPILENAIADSHNEEQELERYIVALQAKQREMREELRQFRASREDSGGGAASQGTAGSPRNPHQAVEKASAAFDRIIEANTGLPGKGDVTDRENMARLAELEALARSNRIKERLAELKSRKG
jgi:phage shock protein A